MEVVLPLEKMSAEEKLQAMENLWDDLCKISDSIPSPTWHKAVLREREDSIKSGNDEFLNWNDAKKHIRRKTS